MSTLWNILSDAQRDRLNSCADETTAKKLLNDMGFDVGTSEQHMIDDIELADVAGGANLASGGKKTVTCGFWCESFVGKEANSRMLCINCKYSAEWGPFAFIGQPGICTFRSADDCAGHKYRMP